MLGRYKSWHRFIEYIYLLKVYSLATFKKDLINFQFWDFNRFIGKKFLEKSSHDAVITVFILAQKGKMAFKTPLAPGELNIIFLASFLRRNKFKFE